MYANLSVCKCIYFVSRIQFRRPEILVIRKLKHEVLLTSLVLYFFCTCSISVSKMQKYTLYILTYNCLTILTYI